MRLMIDATISCPHCRGEIKLTESLAAPLIAATRQRYETQLAEKEREVGVREASIQQQQAEIAKARHAIADEVAARLDQERGRIAAEELENARRLVAIDLDEKGKQLGAL